MCDNVARRSLILVLLTTFSNKGEHFPCCGNADGSGTSSNNAIRLADFINFQFGTNFYRGFLLLRPQYGGQ